MRKLNVDLLSFYAIKYLVQGAPYVSHDAIATELGILRPRGKNRGKPDRSYVQTRVLLANMPNFVQDEFILLMTKGKDATPVRFAYVRRLYSAYSAEYSEYPGGDGPEFRREWENLVDPHGFAGFPLLREDSADNEDFVDSADIACFSVIA